MSWCQVNTQIMGKAGPGFGFTCYQGYCMLFRKPEQNRGTLFITVNSTAVYTCRAQVVKAHRTLPE